MSVIRANFGNLLFPGLRSVFFHEYDVWTKEYPAIFNVLTSKRQYEEDQLIVGVGAMPPKNEGVGVSYEDPNQGWKTRYTHLTFAKGIRITQEMMEDDLYDIMKSMTVALARSALQRQEVEAANIFNRAFNASYPGADGVSLINAAHQSSSVGGTQSNAFSAHADLSASSLQDALEILETCLDEKGLNLALRAKKLIVPVQEQWAAYELTKSEYKPGTSDNEVNAVLAKGLGTEVNHYLTDPDAWFLQAEGHKLNFFNRRPLSFFKGNDFDTMDAKFQGSMRFSVGWSDWRGITGDSGS